MDDLGLYLSIPFCRAKCTFCNFASDAFAPGRLPMYVDRLCHEIASSRAAAIRLGTNLPEEIDTLYFGGGTPSLLSPGDVRQIFLSLRGEFRFAADPEITVECAPNQLDTATLEEFQRQGVNRLSFGVQSFVDRETVTIGRLHTAEQCMREIDRVRSAGILNISMDLIAGLPHQTEASWHSSLRQAIASGVPHMSIYMLEIDEDSRLGREVLAEGPRYNALNVPSDDESAEFYEVACDLLGSSGIAQYEISNFARPGFPSGHNIKYWQRKSYLGFGLDAHSMLRTPAGDVRFANTADLTSYINEAHLPLSMEHNSLKMLAKKPVASAEVLTPEQAFEETLFLGLRMNEGLCLSDLRAEFGNSFVDLTLPAMAKAAADGLLLLDSKGLRLTALGRVLSNEVFSRLLLPAAA